ncbi:MAG TPA: BatA and WFA domain-containing protein [Pirellulales bacterium]|nr:BatA and WFA domain-containing protein [Pirellulales bacterium]
MQLNNMLSWWQWMALGAVPPAIVALYFLKLKRQPLEVPSTYLWHKSIEDLHVNSIWQRLRQSLLLFLQLCLLALVMLSLVRPSWMGSERRGDRSIFLIDNSASMGATDIEPTRLEYAKRQVEQKIDEMKSGDVAMIVSFADSARVEQSFTDNRSELRRRLTEIKQTDRTTSLAEALRVAAGLANPGRTSNVQDSRDFQVAEAQPATLYIYSDGRFPDVKDFALGHLEPVYYPIGTETAANVSIAALTTSRREDQPDKLQAFARLENHGLEKAAVDVELKIDGALVDAKRVEIEPGDSSGVTYDLEAIESGVLTLHADTGDALAVDDTAWNTINVPRRSKILFVTPGNEPLEIALNTERAHELADVTQHSPAFLKTPQYQKQAAAGAYDLVIFDRCRPEQLPQANTWFIGALPPGATWRAGEKVAGPQIIDVNRSHPLTQIVELGDVLIVEATPVFGPPGTTMLIDSSAGTLFAIGPREGYEDAVLGFILIDQDQVGSNWVLKASFPVLVLNVLEYLGGARALAVQDIPQPGQVITWRSDTASETLQVTLPDKTSVDLNRSKLNTFQFTGASQVGAYQVREGEKVVRRFAVNLFDGLESDLEPRPELKVGDFKVAGQTGREPARREIWKLLVLAALAVLLFEWYIYNRRVYI